ncbi:hypothetical protein NQ317_008687 [Molorchus minor]|uniref:Cuticle protein n=1 Tax=Molorchus minor TaxID=1323400 RepID=A0ABQ9K1K5_9CUCU|nr:hypothetical protein NQ317_008687 [Molorchus minor]
MAHVYARPHHMLQTEEEVLDIVEDDPSTSTREIARQIMSLTKTLSIIVNFTILVVLTSAAPQFLQQRQLPNDIPTPYDYQYKVENPPTNTFYGKSENGDGVGRVTGSYYVYLPDGRLMTVDYTVDGESGYLPRVTFSNQPVALQG